MTLVRVKTHQRNQTEHKRMWGFNAFFSIKYVLAIKKELKVAFRTQNAQNAGSRFCVNLREFIKTLAKEINDTNFSQAQ